jgi:hypothetical protein
VSAGAGVVVGGSLVGGGAVLDAGVGVVAGVEVAGAGPDGSGVVGLLLGADDGDGDVDMLAVGPPLDPPEGPGDGAFEEPLVEPPAWRPVPEIGPQKMLAGSTCLLALGAFGSIGEHAAVASAKA